MKIDVIRALWPENADFSIERENVGDEYIFIHCHTPVAVWQNEKWIHTKGFSFVLFGKYSHQLFKADGVPLMHDWMHLTGNMDDLMQKANLEYNRVYELQDGKEITAIMQDLELEFSRADVYAAEIQKARITELFLRLGRKVHGEEAAVTGDIVKRFTEARAEVHRTYYKPWTVESMAALLPISPSRFYATYKKIFWISPKKDLQNIRIEHAKQLLQQGGLSVKEIAEQIGYDNEYYFIRKFKEHTGKTPGQYKKSD